MSVPPSDEVLVVQCAQCRKSLMVPPELKKAQPSILEPPALAPSDPVPVAAGRACPFCNAPMAKDATSCACGYTTDRWEAKKQITKDKKLKLALAGVLILVVISILGLTIYNAVISLRREPPSSTQK
jgi:predicted nucleic acid-binding Zn ribbon protein